MRETLIMLPSTMISMVNRDEDEREGNRERPNLEGQMVFKGDFDEEEES